MNLNCFKYLGLAFALIVGSSGASVAQNASGKITTLHLNSGYVGRGVCIKMNPQILYTAGYACVWKDNSLYSEISDVLREAYVAGKTCGISSPGSRAGYLEITYIECR